MALHLGYLRCYLCPGYFFSQQYSTVSLVPSGNYPVAWTRAKMFTIYKKGDRRSPKNYRGISSVINSCAKLYDMILCCSRLIKALVQTIQRASRCSREARLHGAHCNSSYLV